MRQNTTLQVRSKLRFDELGNGAVASLLSGKERLQLARDDTVQDRVHRIPRDIVECDSNLHGPA